LFLLAYSKLLKNLTRIYEFSILIVLFNLYVVFLNMTINPLKHA